MYQLLTLGDVARKLGVPRFRVGYAIEKAGIQERGRAGILRMFSPDQLPVIEAALGTVRERNTKTNAPVSGGDEPPKSAPAG